MTPFRLALINRISEKAYPMILRGGGNINHTFEVEKTSKTKRMMFEHRVVCPVNECLYFPGIVCDVESGQFPSGNLQVKVDGESVLGGQLEQFIVRHYPTKYRWLDGGFLFQAAEFEGDSKVRLNEGRGFFLPNGSWIQVFFELEHCQTQKLYLKIPGVFYKADGSAFPVQVKKESVS